VDEKDDKNGSKNALNRRSHRSPIIAAACGGSCLALLFGIVLFAVPTGPAPQELGAEEQGVGQGIEGQEMDPTTAMGAAVERSAYDEPPTLSYRSYRVEKGDTISEIANRFNLVQDTILSFNDIKNARLLQIGSYLRIPDRDGIIYDVRKGDTVDGIAEKYEIDPLGITATNALTDENLQIGVRLFLPEARMSRVTLQEINGDLFSWPIRGYISSRYGYRISPFTGVRQFHSGLDIAANRGTPIKAAMAGWVIATGYDANSGNYVILSHHSGYRTFYAHMDVIRVSTNEWVKAGQRIGDVGSTGLSTGSHLHFGVYKNGVTVNPLNLMN